MSVKRKVTLPVGKLAIGAYLEADGAEARRVDPVEGGHEHLHWTVGPHGRMFGGGFHARTVMPVRQSVDETELGQQRKQRAGARAPSPRLSGDERIAQRRSRGDRRLGVPDTV